MTPALGAFGLGVAVGSFVGIGICWAWEEFCLRANEKRTNRDIPDALHPNLDELFAARDAAKSEQQANTSRHSRRVGLTMGDVFEDFAERHPATLDTGGDYLGAEYNAPLTAYVNLEEFRASLPESERDGDAILARLDVAYGQLNAGDIAYLESRKGGEKANAGRHSRRVGEVC